MSTPGEFKFVGQLIPRRGHTLFELNIEEVIIRKAEIKEVEGKKRVNIKQKCLYVYALNAKNADKKFQKMIIQMRDGK